MNETIKKYLPWAIVAVVVLFLARRLMGGRTILAPQTQFSEVAQPDPFAVARATAFGELIGLGIVETQARIGAEVEMARIGAYERAASRSANLTFMEREQDRRVQQSAIDRYYSSRQTSDIIGSIAGAVGSIFGRQGSGGVVMGPRTPPWNPNFRGFF